MKIRELMEAAQGDFMQSKHQLHNFEPVEGPYVVAAGPDEPYTLWKKVVNTNDPFKPAFKDMGLVKVSARASWPEAVAAAKKMISGSAVTENSQEELDALAQELGFNTKTGTGAYYKKNDKIQAMISFGSGMYHVAVGRPGWGADKKVDARSADELRDVIRTIGLNEDWQKVNKKDKTDGMSKKAVAAYRRENPGSKLKTAVTTKPSKLKKGSKDAKRRKSFCARMSGNKGPMKDEKGRPTPKAKALSRWNCEE